MLGKLVDLFADKVAASKRKKVAAMDWQPIVVKIEPAMAEGKTFLETRDGRYIESEKYQQSDDYGDVVSILVAVNQPADGGKFDEDSARAFANKLGALLGKNLAFFMNKQKTSAIAFYVKIPA